MAYKKFKNNVFYDKTAAVNRERIVEFEKDNVDQKIKEIANHLEDLEPKCWEKYQEEILRSIDVLIFPKSIKNKVSTKKYIINKDFENKIQIDAYQYFIDMCVEGNILGVLWIILFGRHLDNKSSMYKHSYGNRLRATLFEKEKDISFYPGMFEPYFSQYTTWRDEGIDIAQKQLKSGNDVIILTMDFKRFYYSVDFTKQEFREIYKKVSEQEFGNELYNNKEVLYRLNEFIYAVIEKYSSKLRDIAVNEELWYQDNMML